MQRLLIPFLLAGSAMLSCAEPREVPLSELQTRLHQVAESASSACVAIQIPGADRWGSGVVIDREKGIIATAHHVLKSSRSAQVWFPSELEARPGRVVAEDAENDLVLIAVDPNTLPAECGEISLHGSEVQAGEWAVAIGYPGGLSNHVQPSLRLGRIVPAERLVTSCRLCPGDSGGPLLSLDGRLIGLHRQVDAEFATHVPVRELVKLLSR